MTPSPLDLVLVAAVWAAVAGEGLRAGHEAILAGFREIAVITRLAAVNLLAVPLVMALAVRALGIDDEPAAGLVLYAATAGGPLGLVATQIARGDGAVALSVVALLEIANLLAIPAWAALLLPATVAVPTDRVLVSLIVFIALPLGVAILVRAVAPGRAAALARASGLIAAGGLVVIVAATLVRSIEQIGAALSSGIPVAVAVTLAAALVGGWAAGGPRPATRVAGALTTAQRGTAVALAIAVTSFADLPGVGVAVIVAALLTTLAVSGAALVLRRVAATRAA